MLKHNHSKNLLMMEF